MSYHRFKDDEGVEFGSFEVFFVATNDEDLRHEDGTPYATGWYWWSCMPGCLPDGIPHGPFETKEEATKDAREG